MTIRNQRDTMQYRRFGRTNRELSVITLGGMRYIDGWGEPRDQPKPEMIDQACRITQQCLDVGINHIETAYGYGKSEHCYGRVLNDELKVPRDSYHLMTKGGAKTADDMRRMVESQLVALKTDHIDLYGWHGINTEELVDIVCATGGPAEELLKMRDEGMIGTVGFSTHGPVEAICRAIATDLFDFVNLHYYYFRPRNHAAVEMAAARDMGVFIISPNDKGGRLFNPSAKLTDLCKPLTPIQFNARWCLRTPDVHTLTFGMTEPEHIQEMLGVMPVSTPLTAEDQAIEQALNRQVAECDPISAYDGFELDANDADLFISEILRFRRMWKCYDMEDFCFYRYNMFNGKGHFFPGVPATPEAIAKLDSSTFPAGMDIPAMLSEVHEAFYRPKKS